MKTKLTTEKWTAMTDFIAPISTFKVHEENLFACFIEGTPFDQIKPALVIGSSQGDVKITAERIVKAVNMHDELIELIKDIQKCTFLDDPFYTPIRKSIKQLLKQAEQK